jgi:hypothetical protein
MQQLRLSESAAREVLLVRAIESEDGEGAVLTREDRQYASSAALSGLSLGSQPSLRETGAFLARRADLGLSRLMARYPALRKVCAASRWPHWLSWGVPLGALAIGLVTNVLDGPRLNILAFPLLGMLAWNLLVYLWLVVATVTPRREGRPILALFERWSQPAVARLAAQPTLERGVARFTRDWLRVAGPLTGSRASRTLHLGAALFAVGVLAGMLARARYTADYTAGWSGTGAGAEQEIAWLLGVILGPASWLTGIALPSAERLRELRGGTENAGNWLILWATTAALVVIVPRLLLALWSGLRAAMLTRRLPVPGPEDFYVRTVLRDALGHPGTARVVPYGVQLTDGSRDRLERLLQHAMGERTQVRIDPPVPYGAEDAWLAEQRESLSATDQLLLLFNLGSTPEAENHGAFARGLLGQVAGRGTGLTLLLDDSAFRDRYGERRAEERLRAWSQVLAPTGLTPVSLSLELGEEEVGARSLERALQRAPVPA